MKAAIIAGGKGTRMAKIAKEIPKALIKIGNKPIIEHQINLLENYGIKEVFILSGYLGDKIKEHFAKGKKRNISIRLLKERKPLGTAGAIGALGKKIKEDFIVLFGDVMMDINIKKFINWHESKKGKIVSIVIHPNNHPFDSNLVKVNKKKEIIALLRKPHPEGAVLPRLSIAGAYIFSPKIFKYIPIRKKSDFENDILPLILKSKLKVCGYNTVEYLKDMGTPKRLKEVRRDYAHGKIIIEKNL